MLWRRGGRWSAVRDGAREVDVTAPEFTFSCHEYDTLLVEGTLHDLSDLTRSSWNH
jgi:hypothetical protein